MNITEPLQSATDPYKTEKTIFKFISTLSSLKAIETLVSNNLLSEGLKKMRADFKSNFTPETYVKIAYPKLGITRHTPLEDIARKTSTALCYAKILKQYDSETLGELNEYFTFPTLVLAIKKIFRKHLKGSGRIFSKGLALPIKDTCFFAKVNVNKICIFTESANLIGKGASGLVYCIFEIASCQFAAMKIAHPKNSHSTDSLLSEIANLKKVEKLQIEGIQEPIMAEINLRKKHLIGYVGSLYEMDLLDWIETPTRDSSERIALCKSLMGTLLNMEKAGIWHGDIKPDNIAIRNNQPFIIDWAGAIFYEEAAKDCSRPHFSTHSYANRLDLLTLYCLEGKKTFQDRSEFIKTAKSLELFSMAITLFMVLTSKKPFGYATEPDIGVILPDTAEGPDLLLLDDLGYNSDVRTIMYKMLDHDPDNRYTSEEAFTIWSKL